MPRTACSLFFLLRKVFVFVFWAPSPNSLMPAHPAQVFFLLSTVRRKRNDSVPVSMMCARSVIRSNNALHNRGFGNTVVHSENGRFRDATEFATPVDWPNYKHVEPGGEFGDA